MSLINKIHKKHGIALAIASVMFAPLAQAADVGISGFLSVGGGMVDDETMTLRCQQLLARVGLNVSPAARVGDLGLGQQQLVEIARALNKQVRLLILDEATSALDVTIQKEILELLDKLKTERNMTYLFICHDIALVQQFCDRVLVMHQGKIVEEGTPDEVIRNPKTEYTGRLIESVL